MNNSRHKGMTLTEVLIAVGIIAAISVVLGSFQRDVFTLNSTIRESLDAQLEARALLRRFTSEVREASPSDLGSFALAETGTSSFAFYTDADDDGVRERIRYFLSGTDLKKGVVVPSGNPLTYNAANEQVRTLVRDVRNATTQGAPAIFQYFNANYSGSEPPLGNPVTPSHVRLVKFTLYIDDNPYRSPDAFVLTTQVSIRNLKDNL